MFIFILCNRSKHPAPHIMQEAPSSSSMHSRADESHLSGRTIWYLASRPCRYTLCQCNQRDPTSVSQRDGIVVIQRAACRWNICASSHQTLFASANTAPWWRGSLDGGNRFLCKRIAASAPAHTHTHICRRRQQARCESCQSQAGAGEAKGT